MGVTVGSYMYTCRQVWGRQREKKLVDGYMCALVEQAYERTRTALVTCQEVMYTLHSKLKIKQQRIIILKQLYYFFFYLFIHVFFFHPQATLILFGTSKNCLFNFLHFEKNIYICIY